MSVSEGQPALTPDQENELRLYAMRPEGHGLRVSRAAVAGVLAELAREREARQHDQERAVEEIVDEIRRADVAEGQVRELQEERDRLREFVRLVATSRNVPSDLWKHAAREALVGLPERQEP